MFRCRAFVLGLLLIPSGFSAQALCAGAWPDFEDPGLAEGRVVWLENCEGCHGLGIAGAPRAGVAAAWEDRLEQGRETLYQHALEGHFGPRGTMMPPRGGNDDLSNEEVKAAVDYMLRLASDS